MTAFDNFIFDLEGEQRAIVQFLHRRLIEHHDLVTKISYDIPVYYRKKWVCYLNPIKKNGIELAFAKGYKLSNEQGLLSMKKRKYVAGMDLYQLSDIHEKEIDEIVQEALILDDMFKK